MKKINFDGLLNSGLGLLIILTPVLLPVCQGLLELANGNKVPMRCHWTAQAEMILGGLILIAGLIQLFMTKYDTHSLNLQVAFMGLAVFFIPLILIPTCTNPDMACNVGTKPALLILGGITFLTGIYNGLSNRKEPSAAAA